MDSEALIQFFENGIPFNRLLGMKVEHLEGRQEQADHVRYGACRLRIPFAAELVAELSTSVRPHLIC